VAYERAKLRSELVKNGKYREPVAAEDGQEETENNPNVDEETKDLVDLLSTFSSSVDPEVILKGITINRGINYNWGRRIIEVRSNISIARHVPKIIGYRLFP